MLQAGINITRAAALRCIAGNIFEFAVLLAARAGIGRGGCGEQEAAAAAFPVGEPATRAEGRRGWFRERRTATRTLFLLGHDLSSP
jgi:hypothetical protein